jgi:hydrogenase expression/formation protein HypD
MIEEFVDGFRNAALARRLAGELCALEIGRPLTIMHVCGTHEHAIARAGIRSFLPEGLRLVAGPGCPVCVCPAKDIDLAVCAARRDGFIIATFGDMFRVPATVSSLEEERAAGRDVRVIYSPLDAVRIAREHPGREVVFVAVGFETTAGPIAAALLDGPPSNLAIIPSLRLIPPALRFLLDAGIGPVEGFILPGHVSTVLGRAGYGFLEAEGGAHGIIAGFEAVDLLNAIIELVKMIQGSDARRVVNQYTRVVNEDGNRRARELIASVFVEADSEWRGIGVIPDSGLVLGPRFTHLDAAMKHRLEPETLPVDVRPGCLCHEVILGKTEPEDCPLFGDSCIPRRPHGPCMVSSEGTCRARYQYRPVNDAPHN